MSSSPSGVCKLTGTHGRYVASHIIPKALTRLSQTGEKYLEAEIGKRTRKRSDSWYDTQLVTRVGEDILADIDTKAIKELRRLRLVWSGWGGDSRLRDDELDDELGIGAVRNVLFQDVHTIRLFFLSLLWRAAASSRPEFENISLDQDVVEDLRDRVHWQSVGNPEHYPIQLFQLISRGAPHNRTPLLEQKEMPLEDGSLGQPIKYVRFYFDGLVAHILLARHRVLESGYLRTCVGFGDQGESIVICHEAPMSRTMANIRELIASTERHRAKPFAEATGMSKAIKACWPDTPSDHVLIDYDPSPKASVRKK